MAARLGLLVLALAWLGPLPGWSGEAFTAHMTMHVLVVAVAAPLLALGLAEQRWDPRRRWPALFAPVPVSVLELVVVWAWHSPALHHLSRRLPDALALEQASFLLVGVWLWRSALASPRQVGGRAAGIVALLMTSMHMTLLGALLTLSPRVLYPHGGGLWGLSPLQDQQLGGTIMLVGAGSAYLIGGLYLLAGLLRSPAGGRP